MYIQRVHSKVIRVHVEALENLLEGHLLSILSQNDALRISLICFLDEGKEVFLRHACSCMNMCVHLGDNEDNDVKRKGCYVLSLICVPVFTTQIRAAPLSRILTFLTL